MKHLILCREYSLSPGGGIGTYVFNISNLLAEAGETVHVISQAWEGAPPGAASALDGRLNIHRLPFEDWRAIFPPKPHPALVDPIGLALFRSGFFPQCFSWQASLLAEELIEQEGIDLIEAQEYEAPLYYLMLRRALGQGPTRKPPCLIHLHSPTEYIARYNDWDLNSTWVQTAAELESYCIQAADALVCPSRTFASRAEAHYKIEKGTIHVIPLPISGDPSLNRAEHVWKNGRVCYIGRLERRKGVVEWLKACVAVAQDVPDLEFEFIGTNILEADRISSQVVLDEMIPTHLRKRFHFRGGQQRSALSRFLQQARLAAVPSRWENFPNTCMEALGSGLPVIATRQGGMVEMIEDGQTGWLVDHADAKDLAEALHQALEIPPSKLAEMGRLASISINKLCDRERVPRPPPGTSPQPG